MTQQGSCLSYDQSDKFSLRLKPLTENIKKQQEWQLLDLWSISSAITTERTDALRRTSGRKGRQISRQLIQVYRRYQPAALSIQQAPKVSRKGSDPRRYRHDRIKWELRMIFSDSVTQQFSDPHSIGFKVPYPEFEKLTLWTRDILFLLHGSAFLFLQHSVVRHLPRSGQLFHPPSFAHLSRFEFSPPPPQRLAWPKALIAKLVYIGEINALQMRLNTYSKKCRQCVSGLSPKSGGRKKEHLCSTKLESQSEACRYSPSHPLLWRKRGGFSICMLVCNSWHYITCRQQSNSCGIVKVLFHMSEQSVEFHSHRGFVDNMDAVSA